MHMTTKTLKHFRHESSEINPDDDDSGSMMPNKPIETTNLIVLEVYFFPDNNNKQTIKFLLKKITIDTMDE